MSSATHDQFISNSLINKCVFNQIFKHCATTLEKLHDMALWPHAELNLHHTAAGCIYMCHQGTILHTLML